MDDVVIHYTRLPDRLTLFQQAFVAREGDCTITLMAHTPVEKPVLVGEDAILEPGAAAVWFTFDDLWHDIGRFHLTDDSFTGYYANVLTPVRYTTPREWATTDLCLDVFLPLSGEAILLDEDELAAAQSAGWVAAADAERARQEAAFILDASRDGTWPPPVVLDWPLDRARTQVNAG